MRCFLPCAWRLVLLGHHPDLARLELLLDHAGFSTGVSRDVETRVGDADFYVVMRAASKTVLRPLSESRIRLMSTSSVCIAPRFLPEERSLLEHYAVTYEEMPTNAQHSSDADIYSSVALVHGYNASGCLIAAYLRANGHDVCVIERDARLRYRARSHGYRVLHAAEVESQYLGQREAFMAEGAAYSRFVLDRICSWIVTILAWEHAGITR